MFFFCIGLPSRFGEWCQAVTVRLVEQILGPAQGINVDMLDQFVNQAIGATTPYVVVGSHQIVGPLWTSLAEANKPFVLALDDPHYALDNLVVRHGAEFLDALRVVAKSCASVVSCATLPGALVLDAGRDAADPVATAAAIARHLGLACGEAEIADLLGPLAETDLLPDPEEHRSWWEQLDDAQHALVTGAVDPYIARLAGGDLGPIVWERDLFYMNEEPPTEPDPPAARPIDITGRPRYFLYGPYITLPPGAWSATIALGFSAEAAELSYLVEVCTGMEVVLAAVTLQPGPQHVVEISLNFSITAPDMIEIRMLNERAAFDGRLALGHVVLVPAGTLRPETRSYLETVLGL
jgi:hypothetical protein